MDDEEGWHRFPEAEAHHDDVVGDRELAVAVVEDGVVLGITERTRHAALTVSFETWNLILAMVDLERTHCS